MFKHTQMILILPNLNKTLIIHPDISERTKVLRELFYKAHLWTRLLLKLPTT